MHIHRASGQTPSKNYNMLYVFCMQYRQRFKMSFLTASRMRSSTLFSKVYRNIVLPLCVTTTRRVRHKSTRQRRQHSWLLASTQLSWRSWKHWAISQIVWQPTHTITRIMLLMHNKIEQFRPNLYNFNNHAPYMRLNLLTRVLANRDHVRRCTDDVLRCTFYEFVLCTRLLFCWGFIHKQHSNKTVLTCMKQVKPVGVSNQPWNPVPHSPPIVS